MNRAGRAALARSPSPAAGRGGRTRSAIEQIAAAIAGVPTAEVLLIASDRYTTAAASCIRGHALTSDAARSRRAGSAVDDVTAPVAGLSAGEVLLLTRSGCTGGAAVGRHAPAADAAGRRGTGSTVE